MIFIFMLMLTITYPDLFFIESHANPLNKNSIEVVDSLPYAKYMKSTRYRDDKENFQKADKLDNPSLKKENNGEDIEHILLIGIDSRRRDFKNGRADTIILASINKLDGDIKLTSIMRDTYVKIPRYKNNRINTAYAFGGAELLKDTVNNNFNLNVDKYVVIDFRGFEKVIDILGGIEVDIKKHELKELNRCIVELGGSRTNFVRQRGLNHLNGEQALTYCRIRKVGNGDYDRTERQRRVLQSIIAKVEKMKFSQYPKVIASMYPYVKTNISNTESLRLIYSYYNVKDWKVESMQIPTDESGKPKLINSMWVIDPDIEECIKFIQEFIK